MGRPQKYSPVGREGIGTSTVVRGKGEGGGGAEERRAPQKSEGNGAFNQQAQDPGDDWRRAEGLTISAGGAVSRGHCTNREGTRASEAGTIPGRRLATRRETPDHCGGGHLQSPSTNTRSKYCQPYRSRGEHAHKYRFTGKDSRSSMAPAASQFRADGG